MSKHIISVGGTFQTDRSDPKTRLKFKEQQKVIKAVDERTYTLSNGRKVMDVTGIKSTLNMRPEAAKQFIEGCSDKDKITIDGKIFVHQSAVYAKSFSMNEQPFKITKRDKVRFARDTLLGQIRK